MRITKRFDFDACHRLTRVPRNHKCARWHGHSYDVDVVCEGPVDERGFVVDYQEIADAWQPIHEALDHHILNELPGLENPTTEILAPWILDRIAPVLPCVHSVVVYESKTTCAVAERRKVYLAGPIFETGDEGAIDWRDEAKQIRPGARWLDPVDRDYRGIEAESARLIVEGDKRDILASDAVIANVWKPSSGTAMEIFFAHENGIPVFAFGAGARSPWVAHHAHVVDDLGAAVGFACSS